MLRDKPEKKEIVEEQNGERHIAERHMDPAKLAQYTGREKSGLAYADQELDPNKHHDPR